MQRNVELKKAWGGKHRGIEKVLKRNKLFNEEERQKKGRRRGKSVFHHGTKRLATPRPGSATEVIRAVVGENLLRADKENDARKMKKESHLVTLNEVRFSLQEGESFSYSHHKRWKIIMHIKWREGRRMESCTRQR